MFWPQHSVKTSPPPSPLPPTETPQKTRIRLEPTLNEGYFIPSWHRNEEKKWNWNWNWISSFVLGVSTSLSRESFICRSVKHHAKGKKALTILKSERIFINSPQTFPCSIQIGLLAMLIHCFNMLYFLYKYKCLSCNSTKYTAVKSLGEFKFLMSLKTNIFKLAIQTKTSCA